MAEAEKNMVFAARLTQQGHKIASMDDLMELYEKSFSVQTIAAMGALPHPTIQKFAVITVAIVGASRRFLAQITRHQNEVKFMSASLQYSNYTGRYTYPLCAKGLRGISTLPLRSTAFRHRAVGFHEPLALLKPKISLLPAD